MSRGRIAGNRGACMRAALRLEYFLFFTGRAKPSPTRARPESPRREDGSVKSERKRVMAEGGASFSAGRGAYRGPAVRWSKTGCIIIFN